MDPGPDEYELLDAGEGRRLERFGPLVLDRPAPGAAGLAPRDAPAWRLADARYEREPGEATGRWLPPGALPERWPARLAGLTLELRPTPAGQVGAFPEHVEIARWAAARAGESSRALGRPAEVLNLFAHTGLATLAIAQAGARVAHVDASRPAVAWARRNAELAGLGKAPVRWLVDDASRFVAREARRGRRYDGVVLDPPTYGHGPGAPAWRLEEGLGPLLAAVAPLIAAGPWFAACTAHATGLTGRWLVEAMREAFGAGASIETRDLVLAARSGVRLAAGQAVLALGPASGRSP